MGGSNKESHKLFLFPQVLYTVTYFTKNNF